MSLDVYLSYPGVQVTSESSERIFIRDDGQTKEISRAEWEQRFPGREPVVMTTSDDPGKVYQANITHNLAQMAHEAGLYECCWRPEEHGLTTARQLIEPLAAGLQQLCEHPDRFQPFNPENGWGSYDVLVEFVTDYLRACRAHPDASVSVWR